MPKELNITLTDKDVLPIDVLIFKKIRIGAFHDNETNVTTVSSIYDDTTEQQIKDNFATWKQEYLDFQPTKQIHKKRQAEYPSIVDQLDMQYWDQVNGTTTWKDAIAKVKTDNPKE